MGKFVKVVASSALAAGSCVPAMFESAVAQSTLPPVFVSGSSSGSSGGFGFPGSGFGYGSGYLSGSLSGGYPEGEYGGGPSAPPPPKTQQQIDADKKLCGDNKAKANQLLDTWYQGSLARCAAINSNWYGYAWDEFLKYFGKDCISIVGPERDTKQFEINLGYQQCLAKAAGG